MKRVYELEVGEKFRLADFSGHDLYQVNCEADHFGQVFCENLTTGLYTDVNGYAECIVVGGSANAL